MSKIRALASALMLAAAAAAQASPWTTIGSAGVVDEADNNLVEFVNGEARMRADAPVGAVLNLRYNILALEGFSGNQQVSWLNRYRDNGAGSRVRLYLRQYNSTGTTSTLATFDSDTLPPNVGYQNQQKCVLLEWDFEDGPFYIEAELTKVAADGNPALGVMMLRNQVCQL